MLKKVKPYMWFFIFNIIFIAIQGVSELFLPDLMAKVLTGLTPTGVDYDLIWHYGLQMIIVTVAVFISAFSSTYFASKIATNISRDLRNELFRKVNSFSLAEFDKVSTSSLITRTTNDITQVQNVLFMILRLVLLIPILFIGSLIMTIRLDLEITSILAVSIPAILILVLVIGKMVMPLFNAMQKKVDNLTLVAREGLTGVRVIRAFDQQERQAGRYNKANKEVTDIAIKSNRIMAVLMPIVMCIMSLTTVAVIWFGAKRVETINDATIFAAADISAVITYITHIMMSIIMITMIFVQFPRASASAKRINEVLAIEPTIIESANANDEIIEKSENGIEFKDVSFNFDEADTPVLENISFTAKRGKTTAVVGSTGSGKSTILNLISRMYDTSVGDILIDGKNVKDYTIKGLRNKMGVVPQKASLFSGTIASNLQYGKEDATESEMKTALTTAQAIDFVEKKPNGLYAEVSQGGANFSGGQKQRLAIARAIIRNADVYIFDDSFSALDFKTDSMLRKALKQTLSHATTLIVAQRISTVMDADNIIVLNEGKIIGQGKHNDLLKNCSVYREIAESQLDEEELEL